MNWIEAASLLEETTLLSAKMIATSFVKQIYDCHVRETWKG